MLDYSIVFIQKALWAELVGVIPVDPVIMDVVKVGHNDGVLWNQIVAEYCKARRSTTVQFTRAARSIISLQFNVS